MVRQAAEGLKYNEVLAAVLCIVDYLRRYQYAFTGIKGMMYNIVRIHGQLIHQHCLLVQLLILCQSVGHPVRKVKELICHIAPEAGRLVTVHFKLRDLLALAEVGLLYNVGHLCFDDLKAVIFQIALYLIICAGMEVQQIFTHYKHRRLGMGSVIFHCAQCLHRFLKAAHRAEGSVFFQSFAELVHRYLKCSIRAALYLFIRADLTQHLFQRVYHRQTYGYAQQRSHVYLKSGMHVVQIDIIICHDGHIIIARIIQ